VHETRKPQDDLFRSEAEAQRFENGLVYVRGYLNLAAQKELLADIEAVITAAPLYQPRMPKTGKPFAVTMTNCGELGWISDRDGSRYQATHPQNGQPWPSLPPLALRAWNELGNYPFAPEACLVNVYDPKARMGLHQDHDEQDFSAPVVSLSLGNSCIFRFGGVTRGGKTEALELASGDAVVLAGAARLAYHGVARIITGTSSLLDGSRINLTLRRVTKPTGCTRSPPQRKQDHSDTAEGRISPPLMFRLMMPYQRNENDDGDRDSNQPKKQPAA
jgi:DNA oxidative demethylase